MSSDYLTLGDRTIPLTFRGWDANTYQHTPGCLAYGMRGGPCQCGALDRTSKLLSGDDGIVVLVPAAVWNAADNPSRSSSAGSV